MSTPSSKPLLKKPQQVQSQVDEVVGVMQANIVKVMERGERIDTLVERTGTPPLLIL